MKSWRKYPRGNVDADRVLLAEWLSEDLAAAGLPTGITLSYLPLEGTLPEVGIGRALLTWLGSGGGYVSGVHGYHTEIQGAPRPTEILIATTGDGHIVSLTFAIQSPINFRRPVTFVKKRYVMNGKFEGDGADDLKRDKVLVKGMRAALSAEHYVPKRALFGLLTRAHRVQMYLDPAYYQVTPNEQGAEIIAFSQVFPPTDLSMLTFGYIPIYKGGWSLGVAQILNGVSLLEGLA